MARILKKLKSLRVVWFIVLLLLGTVPVIAVNQFIIRTAENNEIQSRISRIQNQWLIIANQISNSGYIDNPQNDAVDSELVMMANMQDGRVIVVNKSFRTIRDTYEIDTGKYNISETVLQCFAGEGSVNYYPDLQYIDFAQPIYGSDGEEVTGVILLSASTRSVSELLGNLRQRIFIMEIIEFVLILVLAVLISGWMVRPFKKIKASLTDTFDSSPEDEIAISGYKETREIAEAYNDMLKRLRRLDESRQEFVSNVSHELKTPITSIRLLADSLLAEEEVQPELYREFMADISEEIDRENQIIDDLLTLVRLDKSSADELTVSPENINELLEDMLKRLGPIAKEKDVELLFESFRPVVAEVDKTKFTLAITNLAENAIKYNNPGGQVRITLNADHRFVYVKVADNGIGIPEEAQERVFERFYRVDKARSREAGGTGLGLAITRSIIYSHHGAIKLYSRENEGTTFTVRIPLIYIP